MVNVGLGLQQRQDLKMTAELRQAIEMLQLSALDVQALVRQELADNPCLEVAAQQDNDWDHSQPADGRAAEADGWDDGTGEAHMWSDLTVNDTGMNGPASMTYASGGDGGSWEDVAHDRPSLQGHLLAQFEQMVPDARLRVAGRFLIDSLDDAGYLRVDMAEAAARLQMPEDLVDDARALVQLMDPTGVGARDLPECLRLQLHAHKDLTAAAEVCLQHLDRVAARDWTFLLKAAVKQVPGTVLSDIIDAVEALRLCNPKPGLAFSTGSVDAVVPDALVQADGFGGWAVELNGAAFPKLLANPLTLGGGSGRAADAAKKYASENYGKAKWLIGALEQRAGNILKVARAIVSAQGQFLAAGPEFLIPLTMRQVAERVGVHESTVSRVSRGKYLQTPQGVFEFTHFFASGVGSTGGQVSVASGSVQSMIARLVKAEDPKKPLSDEQIVKKLQAEGVEIARRTVAKYRGILQIPGTAERRVR